MSAISNSWENKILDHILGTAALTSPSVYVALFTASDSTGNTLENLEQGILTNEVVGNGYSRQSATFTAASGGSASNSSNLTWTASGGAFGTIVACAIIDSDQTDSAGQGGIIAYGSIASEKTIADGDSFQISTGNLTLSLA